MSSSGTYVITKERVYLFALKGSGSIEGPELKVYPLAVKPADLAGKVDQFHQRLANRHPDFASIARELYATLIEPLANNFAASARFALFPMAFCGTFHFKR